jgi:hypothetical protein
LIYVAFCHKLPLFLSPLFGRSRYLVIYVGLFLYKDEETKSQNKVEEWWIKLSDEQNASRSRVAAFMVAVA